jgi:quinol monooxygenase YgiN
MGRAFVLSLDEITILSAALIAFGYLAGSSRFRAATPSTAALSSTSSSKTAATEQQAFVLLVNLKFTTLEHRDTFLQLIDPVCKDVQANEGPLNKQHPAAGSSTTTETTLSYKVALSDKDPLMAIVMERYSDKERGYLDIHRSGKEFQKFREQLKKMQEDGHVTIEGESYLETELGYM